MKSKFEKIGLTFDDVLLVPQKSELLHSDIDVSTYLTRNIKLNIPLVSAAMDTVTEARLAIAIAQEGGIGIIHKNLTWKEQAAQVDKVKRFMTGIVTHPITLSPGSSIKEAAEIMKKQGISGFPVTADGSGNGKLVGILTKRDLKFIKRLEGTVGDYMTKNNLVTAPEGVSLVKALEILNKNKVEKLPLIDKAGHLKGLVTIRDIEKRLEFPSSCKDKQGRLLVGAAVGIASDTEERADELVINLPKAYPWSYL